MYNIEQLNDIASQVRRDIIRMVTDAQSGHPGGSLSSADVMTALFFKVLKHNPANWSRTGRGNDMFFLSAGHISPVFYSVLARSGYFPVKELATFRKFGTRLQGHPSTDHNLPGVYEAAGSLGQGLSVANGMAMMSKLDKKGIRVYTILGDGEIEEGQIWEAAMTASQYRLDNLCVIVDNNNLQIDGELKKVMSSYPIDKKFESFGFVVFNVDGNDIEELIKVFESAKLIKGKPVAIIAKTVKGKGISFMENKAEWHGKAPSEEEYKQAIKELGAQNL